VGAPFQDEASLLDEQFFEISFSALSVIFARYLSLEVYHDKHQDEPQFSSWMVEDEY
jgi:hypothetical protein